jgi:hypothetical protein
MIPRRVESVAERRLLILAGAPEDAELIKGALCKEAARARMIQALRLLPSTFSACQPIRRANLPCRRPELDANLANSTKFRSRRRARARGMRI